MINIMSFSEALLIMCIVWAIYRFIRLKKASNINWMREFVINILFVYFLAAMRLIMFKSMGIGIAFRENNHYVNLIPIKETIAICTKNHMGIKYLLYNVGGNILVFVPFGFFIPLLFEKCNNIKKIFIYAAGCSFAIEFVQYFTAINLSDIDDVIFNSIGAVAGLLFYRILYFVLKKIKCSNIIEKVKDRKRNDFALTAAKPILVMVFLCLIFSIFSLHFNTYSAKLPDSKLASKAVSAGAVNIVDTQNFDKYKFFLHDEGNYIEVSSLEKIFNGRYAMDSNYQVSLGKQNYAYDYHIIDDYNGLIVIGKNKDATSVSIEINGEEYKKSIKPNQCFMVIMPLDSKAKEYLRTNFSKDNIHITFYDSHGKQYNEIQYGR